MNGIVMSYFLVFESVICCSFLNDISVFVFIFPSVICLFVSQSHISFRRRSHVMFLCQMYNIRIIITRRTIYISYSVLEQLN